MMMMCQGGVDGGDDSDCKKTEPQVVSSGG